MSRRVGMIVACLAVLVAGAALPGPARADDGLAITSHTVYDVQPGEGRIAVTVDLTITNVVPDTATERIYYTGVGLPIPAGATEVTATSGGVPLGVRLVTNDEVVTEAEILFARGVYYGESYPTTLRYVITDAGGDPERETWIRTSFVAFPVWSQGTAAAGGTSVEVRLPAGYEAAVPYGDLRIERGPEGTRLVSGAIADPSSYFAYVVAEREVRRTQTRLDVEFAGGPATVILHAWPDDAAWAERQASILERGLPALEEEIGVPYPIVGVLNVSEHAYRHLGDYAGWFIEGGGTIEMRFDADAFTTLHEAAHVWLNSAISEERWLLEGFASYYAELVGTTMGEPLVVDELTDAIATHAFPLVDWGRPMREAVEREEYGYAASLVVAREIADAVGADVLREAWRWARDNRPAYAVEDGERRLRGDPRPEAWQRALDLLENASGVALDGTWRTWVLDDEHARLLDARRAARAAYDATLLAAGDWELPSGVRRLMEGWAFDQATAEMAALTAVLDRWTRIRAGAAELRLEAPDRVREAFTRRGADDAADEATAHETALRAIERATGRLEAEPTVAEQVGLLAEPTPAEALEASRAAFEAGSMTEATARAEAAVASLAEADGRGRLRIAVGGGGILLLDLAFVGVLLAARRRRPATA